MCFSVNVIKNGKILEYLYINCQLKLMNLKKLCIFSKFFDASHLRIFYILINCILVFCIFIWYFENFVLILWNERF